MTGSELPLTRAVTQDEHYWIMPVEILKQDKWLRLPESTVEIIGNHVYRVSFARQPSLPSKPREYSSQRIRIGRRFESLEVVAEQVNDERVVVFVRV